MLRRTKIYVLCDPDGSIRYVGKTGTILETRLYFHLYDTRRGDRSPKKEWIASLLNRGVLPKILLLGEVDGGGGKEERAWISYGREEGWKLLNVSEGGEGDFSEKVTRRKSSRFRI